MTIFAANKGSLIQGTQGFSCYEMVTSSTIFTVPVGVYKIRTLVTSGGASGGRGRIDSNTASNARGGKGGNAGHSILAILDVLPGDKLTFLIGAGGSAYAGSVGGNTAINYGKNGGTTSVLLNGLPLMTVQGGLGQYAPSSYHSEVVCTLPIITAAYGALGGNGGPYNGSGTAGKNLPYVLSPWERDNNVIIPGITALENVGGNPGMVSSMGAYGGGGGGGAASYYGDGGHGGGGVYHMNAYGASPASPLATAYGAGGGGSGGSTYKAKGVDASAAGQQGVVELWF